MSDNADGEARPQPALLSVDLQEGFDNDTVIIRLNGQEVYREDGVATMRVLGLADTFSTAAEPGPATLEVVVESRGLAQTIPLEIGDHTHVGLSIVKGGIEAIASSEAFGYM